VYKPNENLGVFAFGLGGFGRGNEELSNSELNNPLGVGRGRGMFDMSPPPGFLAPGYPQ